jgi:signal transduction histidine kinase
MDLASLLAHELEPSLLSLESRLRNLLAGERRDEVEACLDEVSSIRSIVQEVLLLRTRSLETKRFALSEALRCLEERFTPIARTRGIALEVATTDAEALGNPRATERVLSNLLDNAIKFSSDRGAVVVGVTPTGDHIEIAVVDRGIGIAPGEQERIFEPFVRLERERPGSGLGLAIARALAEAQGGTLALASRTGEGSRFVLSLPSVAG